MDLQSSTQTIISHELQETFPILCNETLCGLPKGTAFDMEEFHHHCSRNTDHQSIGNQPIVPLIHCQVNDYFSKGFLHCTVEATPSAPALWLSYPTPTLAPLWNQSASQSHITNYPINSSQFMYLLNYGTKNQPTNQYTALTYGDNVDESVFLFKKYGTCISWKLADFSSPQIDIHLWDPAIYPYVTGK